MFYINLIFQSTTSVVSSTVQEDVTTTSTVGTVQEFSTSEHIEEVAFATEEAVVLTADAESSLELSDTLSCMSSR